MTKASARPIAEPEERRILQALRWQWEQTRDGHLAPAMGRALRRPVFSLSASVKGWGEWTGGPVNELRIARRLVAEHSWDAVCEVLRHEMAHQLAEQVFAAHGEPPHGPAFRRAGAILGVSPATRRRFAPLDVRLRHSASDRNSGAPAKIKKLLALAESANPHEAAAAAAKACALSAKHNLESAETASDDTFFSVTVGQPVSRRPFYRKCMANLLSDHYFVSVIWIQRCPPGSERPGMVLELSGTAENVLMAGYVHDFVERYISEHWRIYRRNRPGNAGADGGFRAFANGVVAGIAETLSAQGTALVAAPAARRDLIRIADARLQAYVRARYPRLRHRTAYSRASPEAPAYRHGLKDGRSMVIRRPVPARPRGRRIGRGPRLLGAP